MKANRDIRESSGIFLTIERLKELLNYNPDTGIWTWLVSTAIRIKVGDVAGCSKTKDYCLLRIDNELYAAHRLAWFYVTGEWPEEYIDHINGNKLDNRFCNLRKADKSKNGGNMKRRKNNTSGFKGVSFDKCKNKWVAGIKVNYKRMSLGYFDTPEEAHAAYMAAAKKFFGEFARAA